MKSLLALNTIHIGDGKHLVYGYPISGIADVQSFMAEFTLARCQRQPKLDLLGNDGFPLIDADKRMLLTGCDSSQTIISAILQRQPRLVTVAAPSN